MHQRRGTAGHPPADQRDALTCSRPALRLCRPHRGPAGPTPGIVGSPALYARMRRGLSKLAKRGFAADHAVRPHPQPPALRAGPPPGRTGVQSPSPPGRAWGITEPLGTVTAGCHAPSLKPADLHLSLQCRPGQYTGAQVRRTARPPGETGGRLHRTRRCPGEGCKAAADGAAHLAAHGAVAPLHPCRLAGFRPRSGSRRLPRGAASAGPATRTPHRGPRAARGPAPDHSRHSYG